MHLVSSFKVGLLNCVPALFSLLALIGCNKHQEPEAQAKLASSNQRVAPHQDPSGLLIVKPLEYGDSGTQVMLEAVVAPQNPTAVSWQALQVSDAIVVDPTALKSAVILPAVREKTALSFKLNLSHEGVDYSAVAQIVVLPLLSQIDRYLGAVKLTADDVWQIPLPENLAAQNFTISLDAGQSSGQKVVLGQVQSEGRVVVVDSRLLAQCCSLMSVVKVHLANQSGELFSAWLVKQPTDAPIASSASSQVSSVSTSAISSLSSAIATSSSLSTATSAAASESSAAVSSASSAPDARELAIAAICDNSWQGLGALPSAHVNYQAESPYINNEPFIDPVYVQHIEQSQQLEEGNTALVAAMEMLKTQPTGVWLDTAAGLCESVNGKPSLVDYLKLAEARDQLLTLVLYNIPARDCVRQERPGDFDATEQGLANYQTFVDRLSALANLYPDVAIAIVVEPTAFASTVSNGGIAISGCYAARQLQAHERSLDYALKRLAGNSNIFTYLDYGDPAWPGSYSGEQALFELLASSQLSDGSLAVEGISLNVGSYVPLDEPFMLAQDNSGEPYTLPKGLHSVNAYIDYLQGYLQQNAGVEMPVLVDTARNGWGGGLRPIYEAVGESARVDRRVRREAWCNARGAGLGMQHYNGSSASGIWVSPPGYSDGNSVPDCNHKHNSTRHSPKLGAPAAGTWFHDYFVDLVKNAYPPLIVPDAPDQALPITVKVSPTEIPVQSAANVKMTLQLPSAVEFTSLSLRFAGEEVMLGVDWLGRNSVAFLMDIIPLTYFHDVLKIAAVGTDGNRYYQEVAVFDSPEFDGKPIMDIALGGRGFFPDFYRLYRADLPAYTYTNNGFEGDDFLWVSGNAPLAKGGEGNDYLQVESANGGDGDDILAAWGNASGGKGNDTFYVWGAEVTAEDTPNDFDIIYWLGRDFTDLALTHTYTFLADGDDLIATEVRNNAENGVLTVKGFFADPPHINEIHYGDGQVLTPETAREMLGIGE